MAHDTGAATAANIEENEKDKQELSTDDKQAQANVDLTQQNKFAQNALIGLAFFNIQWAKNIIDSYRLLGKPLDSKKLVEDPVYHQRVIRSLELVERHEKRALKQGKSKLQEQVATTKLSLSQVKKTYEKLHNTHTGLSKQYGVDARRIYGLNDEQIENVYKRALQSVKDNPQWPLQDVIRSEARNEIYQTIQKEVKDDKSVGWLKRKEELVKRLDTRDKQFTESTQNIKIFESEQYRKILDEGISSVSYTQGVETKPREEKIALETQPNVAQKTPALPSVKLPKFKAPALKFDFTSFKTFFTNSSLVTGKIRQWAVNKIVSTGASFIAKRAALHAIGAVFSAGTLNVVLLGYDILKTILNSEFGQYAKYVIGGIIITAVGIPLLFTLSASAKFFPLTADTAEPMTVVNIQNKDLSWNNFEKNYLGAEIHPTGVINHTRRVSNEWLHFENKILVMIGP